MLRLKLTFMTTLVLLLTGAGESYSQGETFTSFTVQPGQNRSVIVYWVIKQETDSFNYTLQKSTDAKTWQTIASPRFYLSHNYSHIDPNPAEGINYYRVIQNKNKAQVSISETKWIQVSNAGRLYLWPNPANDVLHVRSPFVKGSMKIVDAQGRLMLKLSITNSITDVPFQHLAKGIYFIQVMFGKETLIEKFVKN